MSEDQQPDVSQENTEDVSAADKLYPEGEDKKPDDSGDQKPEETDQEPDKDSKDKEPEEKADEKPDDESKEGKDEADKEIEYDLKMPKDTLLQESIVEEIVSIAKEQGLSNEQAQKVLDMQSEAVSKYHTKLESDFNTQVKEWGEELRADKDIGGEHLKQNVEYARRTVIKFGGEEFLNELDQTGYGNHPGLFKMLARMGYELEARENISGGKPPAKEVSMAEKFYGPNAT